MLRLLLDAGGDAIINHSDIRGATALMLAICSRAEVATLAMLISAGADVNAADLHGRTALMCLCHDPSPTLARLHVRVRRHGNTPTEIAHNAKIDQQIDDDYERFCATLALLLDAGADATARDDADMTVVMLASLRSEERSPTVSPAMMAALVLAVEARMEPELEGEPVGGAVGIPT
jgi:ankyrin repeat protein